ncbi:MAG TPA: hypothetical protein DCG47_00870 [Spirochaetaceae bacterium]|nr:hypothetical protein [Spirochaetaceae bacterium]
MQLPGFAAKLLATERRLAGIAKAASSRALSIASAKAKAAAAALAKTRANGGDAKRLAFIAAAALTFSLVVLLLLLSIGSRARSQEAETLTLQEASSSKPYIEALIMPAPLPGELPFPLARERKSRYTEAEVQNLRPDLGGLNLGDSVERRKAELEAIYNAVD